MTFESGVTALARRIRDQFNKVRPVIGDMPVAPFQGQVWFDEDHGRAWMSVGDFWLPFQPQAAFSATEPPNPTLGDLWIKSDLTLWFYNGIDFQQTEGKAKVKCHYRRDAAQTNLTSGGSTSIVWDTRVSDTSGFGAPGSPSLVIPVTGTYQVMAKGSLDYASTTATHLFQTQITVNGSNRIIVCRTNPASSTTTQPAFGSSVTETSLNAGDVVAMQIFHNTSATRSTRADPYSCELILSLQ